MFRFVFIFYTLYAWINQFIIIILCRITHCIQNTKIYIFLLLLLPSLTYRNFPSTNWHGVFLSFHTWISDKWQCTSRHVPTIRQRHWTTTRVPRRLIPRTRPLWHAAMIQSLRHLWGHKGTTKWFWTVFLCGTSCMLRAINKTCGIIMI